MHPEPCRLCHGDGVTGVYGVDQVECAACDGTPYERGYSARSSGQPGPRRIPRGDASWEEKLWYRGWCDAVRDAK